MKFSWTFQWALIQMALVNLSRSSIPILPYESHEPNCTHWFFMLGNYSFGGWNHEINFAYVQAFSPMYTTSSCGTRTRHKVPLSCPQSRCHGRNVFKPFKSEETWIKYVRTKLVWIPLTATCLQWNSDTKKIRERKLLAALLLLPSEHQWKSFQ